MAFKLTIGAFPEADFVPRLHTCEGADISPSLEWGGEPKPDRELHADHGRSRRAPEEPGTTGCCGTCPPSMHNLAQGYKAGKLGVSGTNDFGKPGLRRPLPAARRRSTPLFLPGVRAQCRLAGSGVGSQTRRGGQGPCAGTSWPKRNTWGGLRGRRRDCLPARRHRRLPRHSRCGALSSRCHRPGERNMFTPLAGDLLQVTPALGTGGRACKSPRPDQ